jgi:hypothetical protein
MSNAELAPITKASCLCALNLSLTRLMLALLASHTATGRSLVCRTAPCALWPTAPLRSLSAVAAVLLRSCVPGTAGNKREQPSTNPIFSRLLLLFVDLSKVLILRLFIGETG